MIVQGYCSGSEGGEDCACDFTGGRCQSEHEEKAGDKTDDVTWLRISNGVEI